ncbi:hypothetical protein LINGRAHAP2_LOCUS6029 [Linum grandiflorum]
MENSLLNLRQLIEKDNRFVIGNQPTVVVDAHFVLYVVGSFLTRNQINMNAMKIRMSNIWQQGQGAEVENLGHDRQLLFRFFHDIDIRLGSE